MIPDNIRIVQYLFLCVLACVLLYLNPMEVWFVGLYVKFRVILSVKLYLGPVLVVFRVIMSNEMIVLALVCMRPSWQEG